HLLARRKSPSSVIRAGCPSPLRSFRFFASAMFRSPNGFPPAPGTLKNRRSFKGKRPPSIRMNRELAHACPSTQTPLVRRRPMAVAGFLRLPRAPVDLRLKTMIYRQFAKALREAAGNHSRRSVLLPSSIGQDATLSRWRERFDSARERQLFQIVSRLDV